ncbi:MAG: polysaccharide deacetylase family protein [Alphaproteobacteria bacterium]|nr:polysaccharide deacetylase family protein [Alphaproteobacteria bacterium]
MLGVFAPAAAAGISADASSAVIFVYQRVGEENLPQSSISTDQFQEHIRELKTEGYTVLPLRTIIKALKAGEALPQRAVAITFEGGYKSTLQNAVPLLQQAGLPFTLFYASDMADNNQPSHMSWKELKALRKNKLADLGILPASYAQMAQRPAEENAALINRAISRYRAEFGEDPAFFSYPYGEYSVELRKQLSGYNFEAAFGQQSGVAYGQADFMSLPRFIMTDSFGDIERFMLTANALPLPVGDVIPDSMIVSENPPAIGFTVTPEIKDIGKLSCFISGIGKADIVKPGGNRIEIRLDRMLEERRTRVNCTMPDDTVIPGQPQSWRWFGMQLVLADYADDEAAQSEPAEQPE